MSFSDAAREWRALLQDVNESFVAQHLDSAMQLAVALYCKNDANAEHAASDVSSADQRDFVALSKILHRLIEAAVRGHMTFLLPSEAGAMPQSTSLKTEQEKQQNIVQSLPDAFATRFRLLLETHWSELTQFSSTLALPRLQQSHWSVNAERRILLRLQTSNGETRTIHVPLRQFHQLRHSVASVLQEMNEVESHPMMRLAYMEQSRASVP
ncbi:hypothetical protein PHMEG_0001737 [Phytophthora megakarya]|uniref:COMM domain-containing protein n=1 Tax=Phytophthora megakarya TaxID=4795 RepID=A0A225X139_9STRA|nr:hypothetical protein PHMEG_0001737 [Phytophthora megakarya]